MIITAVELNRFLNAREVHPHDRLGMHRTEKNGQKGLVIRAFLRDVESCEAVATDDQSQRYKLERLAPEGFFEGFFPDLEPFGYRLRVVQKNGEIRQFYDPYSFWPTVSEQDLYLFNEGNEHRIYEKLGAHVRTVDGVPGVSFAVWAPSAKRVSVVGDFNHWDGRYHPMRVLGSSGVWELFIPGLEAMQRYKFEIVGADGSLYLKTDPYGHYFEGAPHHAAYVYPLDGYEWNDQAWIEKRAQTDWKRQPTSVYELHLGSWKRKWEDGGRPLTYRELAHELVPYLREMGYTHVEFLPVAEHPFDGSWGYQVTGYFAPTHRFGTPDDFCYLVDQLHQHDIGVLVDWVPAHFPTDAFALGKYDGTSLYEHSDPRQGFHQDWGTYIFNYGRHEVRCFLIASALAWFDRFHVDGMRVDAVASMLYLDYSRKDGEWVPNQYGGNENLEALDFLRRVNDLVHQYYPGALMIAEESTSWGGVTKPTDLGGLGFDYKWNMGWMHDTLTYFQRDPLYRQHHQNDLTFGMVYQFSEDFVQVFSHDEVVHGKGSLIMKMAAGTMAEKAQQLRALYTLMWLWPGKKCLFMGSEFGQSAEWNYAAALDWHLLEYQDHAGVKAIIRDLNHLYRETPMLARHDVSSHGFRWVSMNDAQSSVIAFLRQDEEGDEMFLVVGHYTPVRRDHYRVGVPEPGYWAEVINSDAADYGGYGNGNLGGLEAKAEGHDGMPFCLEMTLPPQSTIVFRSPRKALPEGG